MISTGRLVQTLGGKGVFRERQTTFEAIIDTARTGFPYATLEALATRFEIPRETLVRVLHLPPRTLARRKKAHRLSADESDRLLRLARVAARAEDVFGSQERAGAWLRGTVRAARRRPFPGCRTRLPPGPRRGRGAGAGRTHPRSADAPSSAEPACGVAGAGRGRASPGGSRSGSRGPRGSRTGTPFGPCR